MFLRSVGDSSEITTVELAEKMTADTDAVYIDVREVGEFADSSIAGMVNMPLSKLATIYIDLPREHEIVVICRKW
ncbi:rhodanese-like domain-containing protein [Halalkalibacter nanhaiisediminis]|nr:rhodanese-like domain-containing protein [Halalkalibacter nanhaiisediminis]